MIEQEPAPLKLPRKTGIPHSDFFFLTQRILVVMLHQFSSKNIILYFFSILGLCLIVCII